MKLFSKSRYDKSYIIEIVGTFFVLASGLTPRIWLAYKYPIEQSFDFANLLDFAQSLQHNIFAQGWWWHFFSPGMPMLQAGLLNILPFLEPDAVARWSTAIITGLVPLIPYLFWKNTFPWHLRIITATLLSIWPSQIFFSIVLAQDNWVLLPSIILATLSISALKQSNKDFPIGGAILYAFSVSIRQEMFAVLFPLFFSASFGQKFDSKDKWRKILQSLITLGITFGFLIFQRGFSSGRYSLFTEHLGLSIAGTFAPGVGIDWLSPTDYIHRLYDGKISINNIEQIAMGLAIQEFIKRPGFHLIRMASSVFHFMTNMEALYWWLPINSSSKHINTLIAVHTAMIHVLFLTSLMIIAYNRNIFRYTRPLILSILLKLILHAITVSQARYFLFVQAFEMLIIVIVIFSLRENFPIKPIRDFLFIGCFSFGTLTYLGYLGKSYIIEKTWDIEKTSFSVYPSQIEVHCEAENSKLLYFTNDEIAFKFKSAEPSPGEFAKIFCSAQANTPHYLSINLKDSYAEGGFPNRIIYIITVNNDQIFWHDIGAKKWTGWMNDIYLGKIKRNYPLIFSISIQAIQPDIGWQWGNASQIVFKLEIR